MKKAFLMATLTFAGVAALSLQSRFVYLLGSGTLARDFAGKGFLPVTGLLASAAAVLVFILRSRKPNPAPRMKTN